MSRKPEKLKSARRSEIRPWLCVTVWASPFTMKLCSCHWKGSRGWQWQLVFGMKRCEIWNVVRVNISPSMFDPCNCIHEPFFFSVPSINLLFAPTCSQPFSGCLSDCMKGNAKLVVLENPCQSWLENPSIHLRALATETAVANRILNSEVDIYLVAGQGRDWICILPKQWQPGVSRWFVCFLRRTWQGVHCTTQSHSRPPWNNAIWCNLIRTLSSSCVWTWCPQKFFNQISLLPWCFGSKTYISSQSTKCL